MTQSLPTQNHYEVLSLTNRPGADQPPSSTAIKSAYHRALLVHHPDKSLPTDATRSKYTIDQITSAYRVLSDPASRSVFDQQLLISSKVASKRDEATGASRSDITSETVDLDDLIYDDKQGLWYRGCRCGQERGFAVTESQLESGAGDGEALVECAGCSLWIRILFAVDENG